MLLATTAVVGSAMTDKKISIKWIQALLLSYSIYLFASICLLLGEPAVVMAQKPELVMQTGHSSAVNNVWLSPDENTLVSQSVEKLIFWDVKTQRIRREVTNVKSFFISPNDETVATLDKDYLKLDLWKADNGTYLTSITNFSGWSFSHDGKTLVSTHANGILQIWDSASNKILPWLIPTKEPIRNFLFGPENRFVVFGTDESEGTLYVINLDSQRIYLLASRIAFWSLTADGRYLLAQDRQQTFGAAEIVIFEDNVYLKPVFSRTGMTSWKVSPRGTYLAFEEKDRSTNYYEVKSGQLKLTIPNAPWDLKFTPDGEMVYRERFSKTFESYDIRSGTKLPSLECDYPKVTIGPDRKLLFADNRSPRSSFLWDLNKGKQLFSISEEPDQEISSSVFSADGQTLAIVKSNHAKDSITFNVSLSNVKTGDEKLIYEYSVGQRPNFNVYNTGAGFGPGGGGSRPTFQPITLVADAKTPIEGNLAFSATADLLVVGESTGNISLYDVITAKPLFVFRSHSSPVQVFFGDNEKVLSIYNNFNTYRLWDSNSGNVSEEKAKPVVKLDNGKNEEFEVVEKDQTYTLRRKKTGAIVFEAKGIRSCERSRDSKKVLCSRSTAEETECNLEVWDVDSKKNIFSQTNVPWSSALSPDGKFLSLARKMNNGLRAEVWDIKKNKLRLQHQVEQFREGYSFTPDSKIAILRNNVVHKSIKDLGVEEYSLGLWSLADAKKILSLDHVFENQFSLDEQELIAILQDKIVKWDLRTHTGIETEFSPSNNIIYILGGMTFSRTGPKTNSLIFFTKQSHRSELESGVVFLWNTRKNQLYTLKDHSAQITSASLVWMKSIYLRAVRMGRSGCGILMTVSCNSHSF